ADQTSLYIGGTLATPVKGLKLGATYDYAAVANQPGAVPAQPATYQNATAAYASFAVPDSKISLHGRLEYFTQSSTPGVNAVAKAGFPTRVIAYTGTIQYDLWKNVLSRLEFRWDHQADGLGRAYGAPGAAANNPFGGSRRNAYLIAANVVYKF